MIYSPLPDMPAHQSTAPTRAEPAGSDVEPETQPETQPEAEPGTPVAVHPSEDPDSIFEYAPDADELDEASESPGLAQLLREGAGVSGETISEAEKIAKQTPGRTLVDILLERGADEDAVQAAVAKHAGLPFERIDLEAGLDGGFDGRLLQRLTPEFCKLNGVMPLRTEGSRVVVGSVKPDNVFILDEVKSRLGVPSIKLVIVTWFDIRGALEIIGEDSSEDSTADLSSIL